MLLEEVKFSVASHERNNSELYVFSSHYKTGLALYLMATFTTRVCLEDRISKLTIQWTRDAELIHFVKNIRRKLYYTEQNSYNSSVALRRKYHCPHLQQGLLKLQHSKGSRPPPGHVSQRFSDFRISRSHALYSDVGASYHFLPV